MALELKSEQVDSICVKLQKAIRKTRMPDHLRERIDLEIARNLAGCQSLVVRSSSNAEDLRGFSAAGIYDSVNQVSDAENVIKSIKKVWSSLISPRSIRLRDQVGISLDEVYMGVVIQEEVKSEYGGVMVTDNPLARSNDLQNVYINVGSDANSVVDNNALQGQYLYNTLEGQGKTLSLGNYREELSKENLSHLEKLSMAGRFLQSHYSPDYTFKTPLDIEWAISKNKIYLLQIRPYGDEK